MPRTPEEQAEQVARYAVILEAQREVLEAQRKLQAVLVGLGLFLLVGLGLIIGLSISSPAIVRTAASIVIAAVAGLLGWSLGRHTQIRDRQNAERLASIVHFAPSSGDGTEAESAGTFRSTSVKSDQG